uniref:Uncharacterized protein n=1 Tax=viral metagenome TaxID=1070528 RepID=A0A6M3LEK1_9ZZZZ
MERRNFLSLCCLPLLSLEKLVPKRQFIHTTFGKFIEIKVNTSFEYTTEFQSLGRYIYFPIETLVTIIYESGTEVFSSFNVNKELLVQIIKNPLKFVRHKRQSDKWGCDRIVFQNQKFVLSSWGCKNLTI